MPTFSDWTTRHLIYPRTGPIDKMIAAERDPRAMMIWRHQLGGWNSRQRGRGPAVASKGGSRDWSIYLGQNGTAASQYPIKFGFDVNAAPSCANDFVVFPINATGSSTQPNIVAFNQLYSGTAGGRGICNRTATGSDTGTAAEVYWSYNVQGIPGGGAVTASPVLSLDLNGTGTGTKVAFVESGNGSAHFHVLAWKAGDGKQATNFQSVGLGQIVTTTLGAGGTGYHNNDTGTIVENGNTTATYRVLTHSGRGNNGPVATYTITAVGTGYTVANGVTTTSSRGTASGFTVNITAVQSPVTINTFVTTTPAIGSGTASDLAFGSTTDTLSWPFPDYNTDTVYVGNDAGQLYRIKDVFCMGNVPNPDCTSESSGPAPSIDTTWGTGGFVQVCAGKLTAPVYDADTKKVFVGCSDGKLYAVSQNGTVSSLQVGDGTTYGGIVDPVLLDGTDGFVYAVTGSGSATAGTTGILVQAKTTNLGINVMVPIGAGRQCNIHAPTPNNAYWTSPTTAGALMYVATVTGTVSQPCSPNSSGGALEVYGITFGANGTINAGAPAHAVQAGTPGNEWAPLTEFYNANTATDWLFVSVLTPGANFASANITTAFPTGGFPTVVDEGMGGSGIIVDNDSASAQASSLYFGALQENTTCNNTTSTTATGGCAVKLTQAGLQ